MGCIKLDILNRENTGLKVVYRKVKAEPKVVQWFYGVDPLADHPYQVDKSPYAYAWNNPVKLTDPDGRCPICPLLAKGAAGAAVDYMLQGAFNYAGGMSMNDAFSPSNIDKSDVLISGLQGMVPWSVPGGKYGKAAAAAVSDIGINYAKAVLNGEDYTMEQMSQDFIVGFAAQLGSEKAAEFFGEKLTLFRGVNESSPGFENAKNGVAKPRGGNANPYEHNTKTTESPYTSWTTDIEVAENFAMRPSGKGVVLQKSVLKSNTVNSPNTKAVLLKGKGKVVSESEVLLKGVVRGASVKEVSN
jgi:hypothetical protein